MSIREKCLSSSLVEIVEYSHSPRTPSACERFGKVHAPSHSIDRGPKAENDASYDKHGDVLGCGLENDTNEGDDGSPEDGRATAQTIGYDACEDRADETTNKDRCSIEPRRCRVQVEIAGVGGEYIETV